MSDLEELARAAQSRRQVPAGLQALVDQMPEPVPYAQPIVVRSNRATPFSRYRSRCGLRSFVCQIVLACWTGLAMVVGGSMVLIAATAPARVSDTMPSVRGTIYDVEVNDIGNIRGRHIESAIWLGIFLAVVWGVVALPLGITAIVTLERK